MSSNDLSQIIEKKNFKWRKSIKIGPKTTKSSLKKISSSNIQENQKKVMTYKFSSLIMNLINKENEKYNIDEEFDEDRERQLEILNLKYKILYKEKEKNYENIIKEIDAEQNLIFKGSVNSFNLLILKIKCYMKILKEKFGFILKLKNERNYYEVDLYIQKIKNEFIKIYALLNENNKYEYEILTQNYCKFLFLMGVICTKKEEYIKSLAYISLGFNMLKVYFIRQRIASDIKTYNIYAKLTVMLINKLLSDNNISQSLIYINFLSRICETALNIINIRKLERKYEFKFIKYFGYNYLFFGYCFELKNNYLNNYKISFEAYKEAYYFMNKSTFHSIFFASKTTIEKKSLYLSKFLCEKLKDKLIQDELEKQRANELKEKLERKLIAEAKNRDKKFRLKLISSGFIPYTSNLIKTKNIIDKELFSPSNQKIMDKLDNEIISYVYKDKRNYKKRKKSDNNLVSGIKFRKKDKKLPSTEVMKNLCHYKMYDYLMKNDFKEFIIKNDRLEFYSPAKEKNSLEKIQNYLNHKMQIKIDSKAKNKESSRYTEADSNIMLKTETYLTPRNNRRNKILNSENKKEKNYKLKEKIGNSNEKNELSVHINSNNRNKTNIRPFSENKKEHSYVKSRNRPKDYINLKKILKKNETNPNYSDSIFSGITNSNKTTDRKMISKSYLTSRNDLEIRRFDKNIFSNKYFKESQYFDKLINKELDFQKKFLDLKHKNSKMYFRGFDTDIQNLGKISTEDINNSFLMLNNKASYKDVYEFGKKRKMDKNTRVIETVFKSVSNKTKVGIEAKSAMRKVLDRYIAERKRNNMKKNISMITTQELNRLNEKSIMELNNSIKGVNMLLISKNKKFKNNNKFADCSKINEI